MPSTYGKCIKCNRKSELYINLCVDCYIKDFTIRYIKLSYSKSDDLPSAIIWQGINREIDYLKARYPETYLSLEKFNTLLTL